MSAEIIRPPVFTPPPSPELVAKVCVDTALKKADPDRRDAILKAIAERVAEESAHG